MTDEMIMVTDEMIIQILNLTCHPPTSDVSPYHQSYTQYEGIGTYLGTEAELIAKVRAILFEVECGP